MLDTGERTNICRRSNDLPQGATHGDCAPGDIWQCLGTSLVVTLRKEGHVPVALVSEQGCCEASHRAQDPPPPPQSRRGPGPRARGRRELVLWVAGVGDGASSSERAGPRACISGEAPGSQKGPHSQRSGSPWQLGPPGGLRTHGLPRTLTLLPAEHPRGPRA